MQKKQIYEVAVLNYETNEVIIFNIPDTIEDVESYIKGIIGSKEIYYLISDKITIKDLRNDSNS